MSDSDAKKILILDDDRRICSSITRYLEAEGFVVWSAQTFDAAQAILDQKSIDVLLLDLNLPGIHGFDIARDHLKSTDVGIIMITGGGEAVDRIVGLEVGADDFLNKPFDYRELLARIRSLLRRMEKSPTEAKADLLAANHDADKAVFGEWTLDTLTQELINEDGSQRTLTSHEFTILEKFLSSHNRVLTRDVILDATANRAWTPYDRSVDVLISKLRKKLQSQNSTITYISTVRGQGYKLTCPVTWVSRSSQPATIIDSASVSL